MHEDRYIYPGEDGDGVDTRAPLRSVVGPVPPGSVPGAGVPAHLLPVPTRPVRVLLVAPRDLVAESLHRALDTADGIAVVAVTQPETDIAALIGDATPHVVVVAAGPTDPAGIDAIVRTREQRADVPVVLLSGSTTNPALASALTAGSAGFVAWDGCFAELVATIQTVADGGSCVPRALVTELATQLQPRRRSPLDLTSRELEILTLLAQGLSTEDVVERLTLSIHTVRNHVRGALAKLGAHSRLEAVAIATRRGLIPPAVEVFATSRR